MSQFDVGLVRSHHRVLRPNRKIYWAKAMVASAAAQLQFVICISFLQFI